VNKKTKSMIDAAMAEADKAAQKWLNDRKDNIGEAVSRMLDERLQEIVAKLLGFDNNWDRWEVDHCNGRHGESAAGDWLREKSGDAVREWLTKQAGELPQLPEKAVTHLRKCYLETLEDTLTGAVRNKAEEDVAEAFDDHLKAIVGE
jgi:hypothetical protein